ncbi:MAG: putative toxin-antitoxin system toxin component, PIN family [Campylobacterales bacterium]
MVWLFQNKEKISVVSNTLVAEYTDVLCRDSNLQNYPEITKDDMVLETAFNASADYIVTYNQKDFGNIDTVFNIKVVTPKEFLQLVGGLK